MRRTRRRRPGLEAAAIILGLLGLPACKPELKVELASSDQRAPHPAFVIASADAPADRPRYHSVQLLDPETREVQWHLRAAPFGDDASQAELVYGRTPDGFEAVVPPTTLAPGRRYALIVTGPGRGQLVFRVEDDGRLVPDAM